MTGSWSEVLQHQRAGVGTVAGKVATGVAATVVDVWHELWTQPAGSIASLNGLRAVAVLWVVLFHAVRDEKADAKTGDLTESSQAWLSEHRNDVFMRIADAGTAGVDVFFVLSGFLIAQVLLKDIRRTGKLRYLRFLQRRFFRVAPVLYVLVLYQLLEQLSRRYMQGCARSWYLPILFVNNVWHDPGCMSRAWSVATEMQCYLFSPLLVYAFTKRQVAGYALILVLSAASVYSVYHPAVLGDSFGHIYFSPIPRIVCYLVGMTVCYLVNTAADGTANVVGAEKRRCFRDPADAMRDDANDGSQQQLLPLSSGSARMHKRHSLSRDVDADSGIAVAVDADAVVVADVVEILVDDGQGQGRGHRSASDSASLPRGVAALAYLGPNLLHQLVNLAGVILLTYIVLYDPRRWFARPVFVLALGLLMCQQLQQRFPLLQIVLSSRLWQPFAVLSYDMYLLGNFSSHWAKMMGISSRFLGLSYTSVMFRLVATLVISGVESFLMRVAVEVPAMKLRPR